MEFLIFKNSLRYKDKSRKEMKLVLEGKLEARPIKE